MLKEPKNFPVYTATYVSNNKIDKEVTVISKITKDNSQLLNKEDYWGRTPIKALTLDWELISNKNLDGCLNKINNTYYLLNNLDTSILVPKDEWIKIVDKYNKLVNETNKKQGTNHKTISY